MTVLPPTVTYNISSNTTASFNGNFWSQGRRLLGNKYKSRVWREIPGREIIPVVKCTLSTCSGLPVEGIEPQSPNAPSNDLLD